MPVPAGHDLTRAQFLVVDATGEKAWFCNCGSQRRDRTLRWANENRDKVSPVAPPQRKGETK